MKLLGTFDIPISEIDPGQRLREPDGYAVEALAADMRERGQLVAVSVAKTGKDRYRLAAGMHRLAAISIIGDSIRAEVWDPGRKNIDEVIQLLEIDETLLRRDLNPLERGVFFASRKAVYEKLYPETKAGVAGGKARQGSANEMFSFAEATAEKIGLGRRSIEQACRIGNMPIDIRNRIVGTPLANKGVELLNLAKIEPSQRAKVLDLLLDEKKPAVSVAAAVKQLEGKETPSDPDDKQYQKILDAWNRAKPPARNRFLEHLRQGGEWEA